MYPAITVFILVQRYRYKYSESIQYFSKTQWNVICINVIKTVMYIKPDLHTFS